MKAACEERLHRTDRLQPKACPEDCFTAIFHDDPDAQPLLNESYNITFTLRLLKDLDAVKLCDVQSVLANFPSARPVLSACARGSSYLVFTGNLESKHLMRQMLHKGELFALLGGAVTEVDAPPPSMLEERRPDEGDVPPEAPTSRAAALVQATGDAALAQAKGDADAAWQAASMARADAMVAKAEAKAEAHARAEADAARGEALEALARMEAAQSESVAIEASAVNM